MKRKIAWGVISFTVAFMVSGLIGLFGIRATLIALAIVLIPTTLLTWSINALIDRKNEEMEKTAKETIQQWKDSQK